MTSRLLSSSYFALLFFFSFTTTEKQKTKYSSQNKSFLITGIDTDTLHVIVNPVDYNSFNWKYWGLTNDWLQGEIVHELNAHYRKKKVRFFTVDSASSKDIKADRIIEITFTEIKIGQLKERRYASRHARSIITGYTNSALPKPIYGSVSALVSYEENYIDNDAMLQCRIYDPSTGVNIMLDHFEDKFNWTSTTATYTGSDRALTDNDWKIINGGIADAPPKNELVQQLIKDCSVTLISKIKTKIKF